MENDRKTAIYLRTMFNMIDQKNGYVYGKMNYKQHHKKWKNLRFYFDLKTQFEQWEKDRNGK